MKLIKRLISIVIVAVTVVSLFSGCAEKKPAPWTEFMEETGSARWSVGTMEKALAEIENVPLKKLTVQGEYERLMTEILEPDNSSHGIRFLYYANDEFPVERIEKLDAEHVFAVYKVKYEGETAYLRIAYEQRIEEDGNTTYELWPCVGSKFVQKKELSYSDYSHIKIGDSAEEVTKVDDTVTFYYGQPYEWEGKVSYTLQKVLDDGSMIRFVFEADESSVKFKNKDGKTECSKDPKLYTVKDIVHSSDVKDFRGW